MRAMAVIGANYGDEGKGRTVDYLASVYGREAVVIRFNGGSQAGHTVQTGKGRHIFSHFGSGELGGASTMLSKDFILNPFYWRKEAAELEALGVKNCRLAVDHRSFYTTPYDILINQLAERSRGKHRHGSVGYGIFETIERCKHREFATVWGVHGERGSAQQRMNEIAQKYVPQRLKALNLIADEEFLERMGSPAMLHNFPDAVQEMADETIREYRGPMAFLPKPKAVIFEGAQGLMLSEAHGQMPWCTPSETGLRNVARICFESGIPEIDAYFCTRTYVTRHGAGPLDHEVSPEHQEWNVVDHTNLPSEWQGSLRFGILDLDKLNNRIQYEIIRAASGLKVRVMLSISCLDQTPSIGYFMGGTLNHSSPEEFVAHARRITGAQDVLVSYGPDRLDIRHEDSRVAA